MSRSFDDERPVVLRGDSCTSPRHAESSAKASLQILFLFSDTGGGHRASAEALARQFELLFPGSTYQLLDVISTENIWPNTLYPITEAYKFLSSNPNEWKFLYEITNSTASEIVIDKASKLLQEKTFRRSIQEVNPDVVISVHPLFTSVPALACHKLSLKLGRKIPMFTVITDLATCHWGWFGGCKEGLIQRLYVGSDQIQQLAITRGKASKDCIAITGLPIRSDFDVLARALGDRTSQAGAAYQSQMRRKLNLNDEKGIKTILVMGGGEGVGSLPQIIDSLYRRMRRRGVNSTIVVVCGRNESLRKRLSCIDWCDIASLSPTWATDEQHEDDREARQDSEATGGDKSSSITQSFSIVRTFSSVAGKLYSKDLRSIIKTNSEKTAQEECPSMGSRSRSGEEGEGFEVELGQVNVVPLGFVNNIAEYMVAADVLVSKAGPGTIAEAASLGLPIMLTSFLPGQEEGNLDYVVEGGFGAYCEDPNEMASTVSDWLLNEPMWAKLSRRAQKKGNSNAAAEIARDIGMRVLEIKQRPDDDLGGCQIRQCLSVG